MLLAAVVHFIKKEMCFLGISCRTNKTLLSIFAIAKLLFIFLSMTMDRGRSLLIAPTFLFNIFQAQVFK